jgi:hypothetical protein
MIKSGFVKKKNKYQESRMMHIFGESSWHIFFAENNGAHYLYFR